MSASIDIDRRDFLTSSLSAGLCLGCGLALATNAMAQESAKKDTPPAASTSRPHQDISGRPGMSYEQVFNFAFRDHSIPYLLALADKVGREELVEMLRSVTDSLPFRVGFARQFHRSLPADFFDHVVVQETLEDTETVRVQKVTRCLWAETYRAANAADIGYAMWCYNDFVSARLRKEKLERIQTLMQGHDCCLMKWTKEA